MRVLLVTSRHPVPPWRGNQVRTTEWLAALEAGERLLVCPAPTETLREQPASREIYYPTSMVGRAVGLVRAAISGRPFQEGLYSGGPARRTVTSAVESFSPDVVVIQMVRCAWAVAAVRSAAPNAAIIFDAIDAMGLHFDRAAASASSWLSPLLRTEAKRCRRREQWLSSAADFTVAVAERDLAELAVSHQRGRVIPVAGREIEVDEGGPREKTVVLSGNLGYRPTIQGALWFAREVWPRVRRRVPGARWVIAGARPVAAIRELSRIEDVDVCADVPDLSVYLRSARAAIAPMRSGSGVPMKVLEAMAAGLPVVVHPWAADGLVAGAATAVATADDADSWVETLTRLLGDEAAARDLGGRGREAWRSNYHPDVVAQQIRDVVTEAVGTDR